MLFLLVFRLSSRTVSSFSTKSNPTCLATRRLENSSKVLRLFSSKQNSPIVEISPANHGTKALKTFSETSLDPRLFKALQRNDITKPTPIQTYGIPLLRQGYDVMASALTGSGKTLFFSIPIFEKLLEPPSSSSAKGPSALILSPTRELSFQTASAFKDLTQFARPKGKIQVALATGGASVAQQRRDLQNCDIMVATPGRLLQFLDDGSLSLRNIQDVVIDESDRCVDLGFEPQLRRIAKALQRSNRHHEYRTVLCSATFPPEVQRIAADFLKPDYYFVAVGKVGATHAGIEQSFVWADSPHDRRQVALEQIRSFLKQQQSFKTKSKLGNQKPKQQAQSQVIVFTNTKDEAEIMGKLFRKQTTSRVKIVTGDKLQTERNKSLQAFRDGKLDVLVATDVAARGLDIKTIGLVVQLSTPRDVDTYVHRIGRTGRAGSTGSAVTVVSGESMGVAPALVELLQEAKQPVPAWLRGMSYIRRARILEEEVAIQAGGGDLSDATTAPENSASTDIFSGQDFRSNAEEGSWGIGKDVSYRAFDDDAYGSLNPTKMALKAVNLEDDDDGDDDDEIVSFVEGMEDDEVLDQNQEGTASSDKSIHAIFQQPTPSKEVLAFIKKVNGRSEVGDKPNEKILSNLSQQGSSQKLRFEYLGLFPFKEVSDFLMKSAQSVSSGKDDGMTKLLMVAEKPSIAKAIADALSGSRGAWQRRGISRALPVYEFTTNKFKISGESISPCRVTVTSVVGHVFSLGFDRQENQNNPRDPSQYFEMPVVKQEETSTGKLRVTEHLRALAAQCDHLVLWLDNDAEGENICYEVIGVTRRAMELKLAREVRDDTTSSLERRIHRARFSAITEEALIAAFENLEEPNPLLSMSVDCRQELDLRVGVALTRLLTWKCVGLARQKFLPTTKMVSYGPCQTPALSFCVDRARDIEAFEADDFWKVTVKAKTSGNNKPLLLEWIPPKGSAVKKNRNSKEEASRGPYEMSASYDENVAQEVVSLASKPKSLAIIMKVEDVSERISPPVALNTVALLKAGSRNLNMSPRKVMQTAERLYSSGYLSYPRTETTKLDPSFDCRALLRQHTSHPQWGRTASYLLRNKYAKSGSPPKRGYDAGDHPPITCLKPATRDDFGGGGAEWRVYEFVARSLLGSLSDALLYTRQVVDIGLDEDRDKKHVFKVEQVQVESLGFGAACPWVLRDIGAELKNKQDGKMAEVPIKYKTGMKLDIASAGKERRQTRPPAFLQEHELIELMDTNRIGTDASMATHVNNIVDRGYVVLCDETGEPLRPSRPPRPGQKLLPRQIGRYMVPTSLGLSLIDIFDSVDKSSSSQDNESFALLSRPAIRAQMEDEVKQIALGKLDKASCLNKNLAWFERKYHELVRSMSRQRVNNFGNSLVPLKESLRYWRQQGAFEESSLETQKQKGKRKSRWKSSDKAHHGRNGRSQNVSKTLQGGRNSFKAKSKTSSSKSSKRASVS